MKYFLPVLLFIGSYSFATAQTGIPVPAFAQCDVNVNNFLTTYGIPGATFAIAKDGKIIYMRAFGNANLANNIPVLPNNLFRVASISKTITSIALMKMWQNGQVSMSAKVFGPGGILQNHPVFSSANITDNKIFNITVQQLLEHSAGWVNTINCYPNPTAPYPYFIPGCEPILVPLRVTMLTGTPNPVQKDAIVKFVLEKGLDFNPGTGYSYNNVGYIILGKVIEQISGVSYEKYVQDSIFTPLGMFDMHLAKTLLIDKQEREVEYFGNGDSTLSVYGTGNYVPWEYGGSNVTALDATGGWMGSTRDIMKLLVAVDGFATKPDILSPAAISLMTTPSATNPNYAKGWDVNVANKWWHFGSFDGTASELVRTANGYTSVIILNKRNLTTGQFWIDLDNLPVNCIASAGTLPTFDLMESPKVNSSAITISNKTNTSMKLSWTKGNGDKRLVLALPDTTVNAYPMDGIDYTGNSAFGSGSVLGIGNFVVYNGTGDTVTVSGLTPGRKYYFRVIEYNKNAVTGNHSLYLLGSNPTIFSTTRALYVFNGNGNWSDSSNWLNNAVPPAVLPSEADILINPAGTGECILNISQVVSTGGSLLVQENKRLRIPGNLIQQ